MPITPAVSGAFRIRTSPQAQRRLDFCFIWAFFSKPLFHACALTEIPCYLQLTGKKTGNFIF